MSSPPPALLNGQWIGKYSGTNNGVLVADFDDAGEQYDGFVFAYDNIREYPRTFARIQIPKNKQRFSLKVILGYQERGSGSFLTAEETAKKHSEIQIAKEADTEWEVDNSKISVKWKTDVATNGIGELAKSEGHRPSSLIGIETVKSWQEFKTFVLQLPPYSFVFRGHSNSKWRLRTGFHRTGRSSIITFMERDVNALHRHLSGLTDHRFNLADALDYAAFLNLAQHHGYPTPILDWTQSPFVAAYFAYRDISKNEIDAGQSVRILIFESAAWNMSLERAPSLMPGFLHLTFLEPLALNNLRVIPQQSISSVTNVDDLEDYIGQVEKNNNRSYLRVICHHRSVGPLCTNCRLWVLLLDHCSLD